MKRFLMMFAAICCLFGCSSSDDDTAKPAETKSTITIEYLCSRMCWVDASGTEKKDNIRYYTFARMVGEYKGWTGTDKLFKNDFTYTINPPYVYLTYIDGHTETLEVYAVTIEGKSQRFVSINGKTYVGLYDGLDT